MTTHPEDRPIDLLPAAEYDTLVQVNGWLYVVSSDGSLEALDSRDPRYIPSPEEYGEDEHEIVYALRLILEPDGMTVRGVAICDSCGRGLILLPGIGGAVHQGTAPPAR